MSAHLQQCRGGFRQRDDCGVWGNPDSQRPNLFLAINTGRSAFGTAPRFVFQCDRCTTPDVVSQRMAWRNRRAHLLLWLSNQRQLFVGGQVPDVDLLTKTSRIVIR
jgi:hypothetical protein